MEPVRPVSRRGAGQRARRGRAAALALAVLVTVALIAAVVAAAPAQPSPAPSPEGPAAPEGGPAGLPAGLELKAKGAILLDPLSGAVLAAKNAHEPMPPASLTKIMTLALAYQALANGQLAADDIVTASEAAASLGGSTVWLEAGEGMSAADLLLGIAIASANDAATALAEHLCGTQAKFVALMNERGRELGMRDGCFKNPHGLDEPGHLLSAWDVACACRYALRFPDLLRATSMWEHYLRDGKHWLVNTNRLLRSYPGVDGLKTGSTDRAGYCLAATAVRDQTRLVAVVMNAPDSATRFEETAQLLNWGFASFASLPLVKGGQVIDQARVYKGRWRAVPLVTAADLGITVPKGQKPTVEQRLVIAQPPVAPVKKGQLIGLVIILADGREVARADLLAERDVPRLSLLGQLLRVLGALGHPRR